MDQAHSASSASGAACALGDNCACKRSPGVKEMVGRSPQILTQALDTAALDVSVIERSLRWLDCGQLKVETPSGKRWTLIGCHPGPEANLTICSWTFLRRVVSGWDVGFAEAYMAGEVSTTDLVALLSLAVRNRDLANRFRMARLPRIGLRLRHALNRNTRVGSRRNISAHYDLGNSFYRQWLDSGLSYSAAKFSPAETDLESAQTAKLDSTGTALFTKQFGLKAALLFM